MTRDEILKRFPNASPAFIRANLSPESAGQAAFVERRKPNESRPKAQAYKPDTKRFLVRVQSVRKRLLDEDRICEVAMVDCCRYAGIIPRDSPDTARIETTQRKCLKGEAEHTEITIHEML